MTDICPNCGDVGPETENWSLTYRCVNQDCWVIEFDGEQSESVVFDAETVSRARGQILDAHNKLMQKGELGHYDSLARTRAARAYLQLGGEKEELEAL